MSNRRFNVVDRREDRFIYNKGKYKLKKIGKRVSCKTKKNVNRI